MQLDKALSMLEKQMGAGTFDKALLTYRVIADSSWDDIEEAQATRLAQILGSHKQSLFVEFLEVLNKYRGFSTSKDVHAADRALQDIADRGEANACIQLAMRHVTDSAASAQFKAADRARLQPHVLAKLPMAVALDAFLDFNPAMDALLSNAPQLAVHNACRQHEAALSRLIKIMAQDQAKYEALKASLA